MQATTSAQAGFGRDARRAAAWVARGLWSVPFLTAALVVGLATAIAGLLFAIQTPYQVLLPGPVTDVQRLIQPYPKPIKGTLYLTTIYSDPASAAEWLYAKLNPEAGVVPREQARPKDVSEKEYQRLLTGMMDESKVAAKVVALREAGYDVKITGQGAQIREIAESSLAKGLLFGGDVVVAADGEPVTTANDLVARIQAHRPGETVTLRIWREGQEIDVTVPLGESPDEPGRARAGVVVLTHLFQYELPRELDLKTRDIGGPSAGLMFALGVYNSVAPVDITRGHKIAGTGTISTDGKVGAVGGVKYKVAAAEKAGAEIFLVPRDNLAEARERARTIQVVPVGTFQEALAALEDLAAA
jgi:PDZ domain-containing protein